MTIKGVKIWLHAVNECQGYKHLLADDDLEDECLEKQVGALLAAGYVEQPHMRRQRNLLWL